MARLQAAGLEPAIAAERGMRDAPPQAPGPLSLVEGARETAKDPEGATRRAWEWAEASRDALGEQAAWIERNGPFGEAWRSW